MSAPAGLCVRDSETHGAMRAAGSWLCAACLTATARRLRELGALHEALAEKLTPSGGGGQGESVSGSKDMGLKLNPRAMTARSGILATLAHWSGVIAREREIRPPAGISAASLAEHVGRHLDWLCGKYDDRARDVARSIEAAHRAAQRIIHPPSVRRMQLGLCGRRLLVPAGASEVLRLCGGTLFGYISLDAKWDASVCCDTCGYEVPQSEWVSEWVSPNISA